MTRRRDLTALARIAVALTACLAGCSEAAVSTTTTARTSLTTTTATTSTTTTNSTSPSYAYQPRFQPELLARGSPAFVYVLGVTGRRVELLRSTDDGLHFSMVSLPAVSRPTTKSPLGNVESLAFGTALTGSVQLSTGAVYATDDGGLSWRRVRLPVDGNKVPWRRGVTVIGPIEVPGGRVYLLAVTCTSETSCPSYRLYRSIGWFRPWLSSEGPDSGTFNAAGGIGIAGFGRNVWLTVGNGESTVRLLGSSNGGASFALQALDDQISCGVSPTSTDVTWLTCSGGMLLSFARSVDGGRHFSWLTMTGAGTGETALWPVSASLVFFRTVAGTEAGLYVSVDGGRHFARLRSIPAAFGPNGSLIERMSFGSSVQGLVLTQTGELFRTSDGGMQWTRTL